jgi:hypothetical protein
MLDSRCNQCDQFHHCEINVMIKKKKIWCEHHTTFLILLNDA